MTHRVDLYALLAAPAPVNPGPEPFPGTTVTEAVETADESRCALLLEPFGW